MKVLVINQSDTKGGAAIVPWRLWEYITKKDKNIETRFLVSRKYSNEKNVFTILPKILFYSERVLNKITDALGLQYFFLPFSTVSILVKVHAYNPDIIHINNIHGGYFWLPLLSILSKKYPVLWTAHDIWPVHRNSAFFVGHDHWTRKQAFPGEKSYYPKIGIDTGNLLLHYKEFVYKHAKFSFVTPSLWMKEQILEKSPIIKGKTVTHIYNGIDFDFYKNHESKTILRARYAIPKEAKVLIFIAAFLDVPLKGMKELIETLKLVDARTTEQLHLICIGDSTPEMFPRFKHITLHQTGYISDPKKIRDYFALSDLFLYPSKAESLGMVVIESIASGTPAIVFNIGGCPEIIHDGVNGYVIPAFRTDIFAEKALDLLSNRDLLKQFADAGLQLAREKFSIEKMATAYLSLCSTIRKPYEKKTH